MTYQGPVYGIVSICQMDLGQMVQQCVSDSRKWFPATVDNMPLLALCIAGEVGEVANLIKKVERGSFSIEEAVQERDLPEEIVDVLIYVCNLMGAKPFKDVDWKAVWDKKRAFNEARFNPKPRRESYPTEFIPDSEGFLGE